MRFLSCGKGVLFHKKNVLLKLLIIDMTLKEVNEPHLAQCQCFAFQEHRGLQNASFETAFAEIL